VTSAPDALSVIPASIPITLAERDQWVAWRFESRDDRWTKVPVNARSGRRASATDPSTWSTLGKALAYADEHDLPGIGYVFSPDDPFTGIDIDGCRDAHTGELTAEAAEIVARLGSYTEASVSGRGVHVIIEATLPPGRRRQGPVEMYSEARFFTVSGNRVPGTPATVEPRQDALDDLHRLTFPAASPRPPQSARVAMGPCPILDDEEALNLALRATNGGEVARLWSGDMSAYDDDESRADAALLRRLAFYTQDPAQLDRLMQGSGLNRGKWEDRPDYRDRTISFVLAGLTETYTPSARLTVAPPSPDTSWDHDPAGGDTACHVQLARMRQERDEARADRAAIIATVLNPDLSATEKVAIVAAAHVAQTKRDRGELEADGSVRVTTAEVSDDWRPAPLPGERVAPRNPTGTLPRMARSRVRPTLESIIDRGLLPATPRRDLKTRPGGEPYWETVWTIPASSPSTLLAPAASWRPEEPAARKPRRRELPCVSCGEVHPIIRVDTCQGCGSVRNRTVIAPIAEADPGPVDVLALATTPTLPALDNLSDIGGTPPERVSLPLDNLSDIGPAPSPRPVADLAPAREAIAADDRPALHAALAAEAVARGRTPVPKSSYRSPFDPDMTNRGWKA
jgi:hypothetical protein